MGNIPRELYKAQKHIPSFLEQEIVQTEDKFIKRDEFLSKVPKTIVCVTQGVCISKVHCINFYVALHLCKNDTTITTFMVPWVLSKVIDFLKYSFFSKILTLAQQ